MRQKQESDRRHIAWLRVLQFAGLFTAFGCFGGDLGCPDGSTGAPPPPLGRGIQLFHNSAEWHQPIAYTRGETFGFQVQVIALPSEVLGETVTVTPEVPFGCTVEPATQDVVLTAGPAMTNFTVTVAEDAPVTDDPVSANRTEASPETIDTRSTHDSASFKVVDELVTGTITPSIADIPPGSSGQVTLAVLPRGITSGTVRLFAAVSNLGLEITPNAFDVTLVRGSTTPVNVTLTVTASATPSAGGNVTVSTGDDVTIATSQVRTGADGPTFNFIARPNSITVIPNELSEEVEFVVISQKSFAGPVLIKWVSEAYGATVSPTDNDFTVDAVADQTTRFTRRFYRYEAGSTAPVNITWTATAGTITKTTTVQLKFAEEERGK